MHNLYAIFAKLLNICKQIADNTMTGVKQLPPYVIQSEKEWKPTFPAFAKARKRIETLFSQLCDQFMIKGIMRKIQMDCLPGLSGRLAHLQSSNILTTKMKSLLAELNMRYLIPPTGSLNLNFTIRLIKLFYL